MSDSTDRGATDPASTERGDDAPEDDFYRGGGAVVSQSTTVPSLPRLRALDVARPPAWGFYPLFLVGALGGLFVFTAAWDHLGDGALPMLAALLAGVVVLAGTALFGGLLLSHAVAAEPR